MEVLERKEVMANPGENPATAQPPVATQPPATKQALRLPAIDGLRGLAAMAVVFFHCWGVNKAPHWPQFTWLDVTVPLYRVFIPGYSGVYLFFVLSGFCLAYPFLSNPTRKDDWLGYALNRVRRIWPPYVISFLALFLIGQWLNRHTQMPASDNFLFETFKTNKFLKEVFLIRKSHIVASYWTMVLEWRWYLFFPALLLLARRISPVFVVAAMVGIAYLAQKPFLAGPLETATFGLMAAFLPMFALGIWAAHIVTLAHREGPQALHLWERWMVDHSLLGLITSFVLCLVFCSPMGTAPNLNYVIAWGPTYFFLVLAALHHPLVHKIFSSPVFVQLGVVSYSIYLLQEPILRAGHLFISRNRFGDLGFLSLQYLLMPLVCALAGWAFYYVGERPFLKRPRK